MAGKSDVLCTRSDVEAGKSDAMADAWAAALVLSSAGALELEPVPKRIVVGAGTAGGGDEGKVALAISGSTSLLAFVADGKKLGLHLGMALLGALGVTGSGSSAVDRFLLPGTRFSGFPSRLQRSEHLAKTWLGRVPKGYWQALKLTAVGKQAAQHSHGLAGEHVLHMNHRLVDCVLDSYAIDALRIGICCISRFGHSYPWGSFF